MSEDLLSLTRRLIDAETEKKSFNKDQNELIKTLKEQIAAKVKD